MLFGRSRKRKHWSVSIWQLSIVIEETTDLTRPCQKQKIPPALAAWSLNFRLSHTNRGWNWTLHATEVGGICFSWPTVVVGRGWDSTPLKRVVSLLFRVNSWKLVRGRPRQAHQLLGRRCFLCLLTSSHLLNDDADVRHLTQSLSLSVL